MKNKKSIFLCFVIVTILSVITYKKHDNMEIVIKQKIKLYKQPRLDKALVKSDKTKLKDIPYFHSIEEVNSWVNSNVKYTSDQKIYDVSDYWSSINETLDRKSGDCEDFAIAKYLLILWHSDIKLKSVNFYLVQIKIGKYQGQYHLVLVADNKVMDSLTDDIIRADSAEFDEMFLYKGSPEIKQ